MVWFQCEDCGENLKKPKLANHFRMCSARKLSCIDCGQMFDQQSVQSHTQCITEAEKYGPKGQGNIAQNGQTKPDKPKKNSDVDINVGLSSRPPWFCSLCNTQATSQQALLLHADGKKHRAKARAFHASQKQSIEGKEATANEEAVGSQIGQSTEVNGTNNKMQESGLEKDSNVPVKESQRKRKIQESDGLSKNSEKTNAFDITNGEVVQAEQSNVSKHKLKKKKGADETLNCEAQEENQAPNVEASQSKIKWKKIVSSTLKSSDGVMKIRKLQKLIVKALRESGVTEDEVKLRDKLMHKINSSTKFTVDNKRVRLVMKTDES